MTARRSILRQAVAGALLLELLAALLLLAVTAVHERHVRYRAFAAQLEGKAAAMLGAVSDKDDASDDVMLDTHGLAIEPGEFYEVREGSSKVLGRSPVWPFSPGKAGLRQDVRGRDYQVASLRGIRVVDPGEHGGKPHPVTVLYGAPLAAVQEEIGEVVRFQALASAAVLFATALLLAWLLRRALHPLRELTKAAANLSAQSWRFDAPPSAAGTRELAPLSAAMEASVARLGRSFAQQRRFTSDAAHELKTDVAIIKSSLQLLTLRNRSAAGYREGLARSLADCERLEETVNEMLTLARIEHGSSAETSTSGETVADLHAAADSAMLALEPLAALRGIRLELDSAGPQTVLLFPREGSLLCTNLLENAIRHSRPGGAVALTLTRETGAILLNVRDGGEGIPPSVLPHIFEPFFRGDEARDRKRGGAGLGLAICKAICDKAGGSIEVESRECEGTRVTVRLPSAIYAGKEFIPVPAIRI